MINIIKGDVTNPVGYGKKLIVHCVNSDGVMGSGVALSLLNKWPRVKSDYILWSKESTFNLGNIQYIDVESNITVGNLVGQKGVVEQKILGRTLPPVRYEAINEGLLKAKLFAIEKDCSVHVPLLGAKLAGGKLQRIVNILFDVFHHKVGPTESFRIQDKNVRLFIYAYTDEDFSDLKACCEHVKLTTGKDYENLMQTQE